MRTTREILEQYGKCCVSEYRLTQESVYPDDARESYKIKDDKKLESIRGQKISLEWLFEGH